MDKDDVLKGIQKIYSKPTYSPITLFGELILDGDYRKFDKQKIRIEPILNEITEGSSCLDIGCNTGHISRELIHKKNVELTGIDRIPEMIDICEYIEKIEKTGSKFIISELDDYIKYCKKNSIRYDNVLLLSILFFKEIDEYFDKLLEITNNKLFIELTNYSGLHTMKLYRKYTKFLDEKECNYKIISITDIQNRILIRVDKNAQNK